MIFSGPTFLFAFLPLTLLGFYLIRRRAGHSASIGWLTLASLVFYSWWNINFLPLLLISIGVNYALSHKLNAPNGRAWLTLGIIFNLGLLGVFKYTDFFIRTSNALFGSEAVETGIALPLAISFFTFQQIAFLVDRFRRKTEPARAGYYPLFVAFFPQLIAGPIVHHKNMASQLRDTTRQKDISFNLGVGISIFAVGLAKKLLLADNFAPFASQGFNMAANGDPISFWSAWAATLCYAFQIFFDFSGYSDMALGLGRMFGFQLPVNFNAPYRARSVTDFWRRWHITLSHFLRDYLYIPLGGNRRGPRRTLINLALVMLLGGLWHGAAWTFVVWGGLHGLGLIWCRLLKQKFPEGLFKRVPQLSVLTTFLFVSICWVFFRAESFDAASIMLTSMSGMNGLGIFPDDDPFIAIALGLFIVWVLPDTVSIFEKYIEPETMKMADIKLQKGLRWRPSPSFAIITAILLFLSITNIWSVSEFIYYNF